MSTLFEQLEKQARMLTPQEKASLARILIQELDASPDIDVEQLWIAESQRRYEAYVRGELKSVPGEEVMLKRPPRAKLTEEEVLERMKEFPERKKRFLDTARTPKS